MKCVYLSDSSIDKMNHKVYHAEMNYSENLDAVVEACLSSCEVKDEFSIVFELILSEILIGLYSFRRYNYQDYQEPSYLPLIITA